MSKKLIKCKTCGTEVAASAKVCPQCGGKVKKGANVVAVIIAAVVFIAILAAIFGGNDSEPVKVGESSPPASPTQTTVPEKTTFAIGDIVDLNDVTVTLVDVQESTGSTYNKPDDGQAFVLCSFVIENNSSEDIAVSSMMSFEAYVDDFSTSMSLTAQLESQNGQLDGSVAAGKKMSGSIGYEVPSDWKELEIHYTPDFWNGKDITFTAEHS